MEETYRQLLVPFNIEGRLNITAEEYLRRQALGEKYCSGCKDWHPLAEFHNCRTMPDGLQAHCKNWRIAKRQARRRKLAGASAR
jgi:hypothetical protein